MILKDDRAPEMLADALGDLARQHKSRLGAAGADEPGTPAGTEESGMTDQSTDLTCEDTDPQLPEAIEPSPDDAPVEGEPAEPEAAAELPDRHPAIMRTRLREFGEQFHAEVTPLVEPIRSAADTVASATGDWEGTAVLPALRELAHQVQMLCEKVSEQQAYVLIFGPLKSGKSTFMNAVCSAYVSEVTSLPAYPCIVNVSHSEETGFVLTQYDGTTRELADHNELRAILDIAHEDLMRRIREVEAEGESFEPARHQPGAIRKIDVHLPTGDLAESGAVLVDTPGLYSRMKFGYDQMTRDFRHAAACAIFIVKTDNLFLEQVFDEFQELLDLFSRVFLIVNLDVTKRDLAPDGSLVPSLEREDPQQIIEAFRNLSLSAPLKAAADAGRLRIYPVDLLHAASDRIRRCPADEPETADAEARGAEHFEALLTDLTDYLNSTEYLQEFLVDSLRRAESLLDELGEVTEHDEMARLRELAGQWTDARDFAAAQLEAVGRLEKVDWPDHAAGLRSRLRTAVEHHAAGARQETEKELAGEVHRWFEGDGALSKLTHDALAPLATDARRRCDRFCREEMRRQVSGGMVGLDLPDETPADLKTAEIGLEALARAAEEEIPAAEPGGAPQPPFRTDQIPVRRGFWDWVLLRSKRKVRRRLFGPADRPDAPIPAMMKAKRLGQPAEDAMLALAEAQAAGLLSEGTEREPDQLVDAYVTALAASLEATFAARDTELRERIADLESRLAEADRILKETQSLSAEVGRTTLAVEGLRDRFASPVVEAEPEPADLETGDEAHDLWALAADEVSDESSVERAEDAEADEDAELPSDVRADADRVDLAEAVEEPLLGTGPDAFADTDVVEPVIEVAAEDGESEIEVAESLLDSLDHADLGAYRPVSPPPLPGEEDDAAAQDDEADSPVVLKPVEEAGDEDEQRND